MAGTVKLTLLESGRRGTRRAGGSGRRPNAYARFVAEFRREHPRLKGPDLFVAAGRAYQGEGSSMAKSRTQTSRKRTSRNPGGGAVANPVRYHTHPTHPYSHPAAQKHETSKRRRTKRNPFGLEKVTERAYGGISPEQGVATGVAVFGTELLGGMVADKFNQNLPSVAMDKMDLMYAIRKTWPRAVVGILGVMGAHALGVKRDVLQFGGAGALASTLLQFVGALHIAPRYIKDGSLIIGGHDEVAPPTWVPPLPPARRQGLPAWESPAAQVTPAASSVAVPPAPSF